MAIIEGNLLGKDTQPLLNEIATSKLNNTAPSTTGEILFKMGTKPDIYFHKDLRVDNDLGLIAPRVYNAVWNDYAELFEKENKWDDFEVGEIVSWNEEGVRVAKTGDRAIIGVVSDSYGHLLGGTGDKEYDLQNFVPVGIAGRVKVKVVGETKVGQSLYLLDDGIAYASDEVRIERLGIVLENTSDEYDHLVTMLIK